MTILQKPETINLSGNLVDFILSSSSAVSFVLKQDTRVLFEGNYTPNDNQRIEIDVKDIIEADLKAVFSDSSEPYEQSELVKTYTAEIAEQTHSFTVIKAGVDRLATSAANFLKANWLTWQPQVKKVTYYLPESLTFYSVEASVVKVKAYFQQPDGGYSEETKQLLSIVAGKAYTVPVQYAVIAGKFESRLPAFYDVWFETVDGVRLSYIQRYVSSGMMSEDESWIVFENSLGGFDTFRAYGQESLTADHDHQLAEIGDITDEYNVDTTREFQKNTGYLVEHERKWLLDFFPSRQKYLYSSNYLRRIVVTEDDTSYTGNELPSSYTFNYRFADAKPYLNLQRVEELPSDLTISIPDLSSFTIPPRLVEFPSQNLTEGVMFPVQNPYSENWATTTIGAILSYIMNKIIELGGDGTGGVGHTHGNFDVLKALEYIDGYLTHNGQKIKAGYADEAGKISEENDVYLHKDRKDQTNFLLKLLGGIVTDNIQSQNFVAGALGTGHLIKTDPDTGKSYVEIDELFVRLKAVFAALEIMELTYSGGNYIFGPAGARCTKVEEFETYFRCYFTADDGSKKVKNKFRVDDFVQCREFNIEEGVHENVSNKYYWRRCVGIGEDYIDLSKTDRDMTSDDVPAEGDNMVTIGNKTDASRQNVIIISVYGEGSPSFIQYSGINTYSLEGKAKTIISPSRNEFRGTFLFESGDDVKGYVDGEFSSVRSDVAQLKIKDQEIVLSVSSAQSTAEAAKGTATNALNTANAAQNTASAAKESVAQIKVQVDNISLTVSTVEKKADDAQSAADSANSAISTVKTDVASLQLQVGNISLTVSSVEEKADAAQSTASSAASTASSAYNTAQSANSTASSAASTASSASSTADNALEKAENAQDNASSAISQVSSLQVQVGSITSTVSRLENGNELVSIINQTSTTIKLSALKIDLNGTVTANGTFSISTAGYITCTGGTIGGFSISSNSITCDGGGSTLSIGVSGGKFFRVNSTQDDGFMRLRADNDICLDITSYGESNSAIGLKVRCNAAGYGYAISSIGNVQLTARDGEYIKISGLTVNCKYVSSYPYQVQTCDDYLRVAGSSVILNFPHPGNAGKIYFIRSAATSGSAPTIKFTCTQNRLFRASNGDIVDYIQYYDYKPRILMSDGVYWHEFISA